MEFLISLKYLFFFVISNLVIGQITVSPYLPHGSDCNTMEDRCDKFQFLGCDPLQKKCLCLPIGESIYDPYQKMCRLLESSTCTQAEGGQPCAKNSECLRFSGTQPYTCQCIEGFQSNKNRECYHGYLKRCDIYQYYCDPAAYLYCNATTNLCDCNNGERGKQWYDDVKRECRVFLGFPCQNPISSPVCGDGAHCDLTAGKCVCNNQYVPEGGEGKHCIPGHGSPCSETCSDEDNTECVDGVCQCAPGFEESGNGENISCLPGYQTECSHGLPCNPEFLLKCNTEGWCECAVPEEQVFIPERRACGVMVGGNCTGFPYILENACIDNSTCINGNCYCDLGFRPSLGGYCSNGNKGSQLNKFIYIVGLMAYIFG